MKSLYIITGGILVMVAVVFLAPQKQSKTEEKTSGQLDEIEAIILNEYGDDLTPEDKEIIYEAIAEELALEKAEIKKYGRVLTDEERFQLEWQAEVKARQEAEFAELYAGQKDWIDNFPFRPGYHPDILYDPENIAHSDAKFHAYEKELQEKSTERWLEITDKDAREIWARTDLTREEKKQAEDKLWQEFEEFEKPAPEIMAERRIIERHKKLAGFYEQHYRYLPEFEQAYRIFEEEGLADNPIRIAHTMATLEMYKEASLQDPDELHHFKGPVEGKKGNHPYTNQQFLDRSFHWLTGTITFEGNLMPGETPPSLDQARRIANRLAEEIPADGFTGNKFLFGLADPEDDEMQAGQSLLVE